MNRTLVTMLAAATACVACSGPPRSSDSKGSARTAKASQALDEEELEEEEDDGEGEGEGEGDGDGEGEGDGDGEGEGEGEGDGEGDDEEAPPPPPSPPPPPPPSLPPPSPDNPQIYQSPGGGGIWYWVCTANVSCNPGYPSGDKIIFKCGC